MNLFKCKNRPLILSLTGMLFILSFMTSIVFADSPIIIDHTSTDLRMIPVSAIENAKTNLHIAYGHTSHGSQLISGMGDASDRTQLDVFLNNSSKYNDPVTGIIGLYSGLYVWNDGPLTGALDLDDYAMDGDVGYYPEWENNTRSYLGSPDTATGRGSLHPDVNVIIWSWCGQVSSRTQASMISTYLGPMSQLEIDYPNISFVYMTGHLDHWDDADNKRANDQIRDYCTANNKILYDFADIESYDPDGTFYEFPNDSCDYYESANGDWLGNWAQEWQNSHIEGVDWWSSGASHSENLNGNLKGYAAWWLWARLGGWGGDPTNELPSFLTKTQVSQLYVSIFGRASEGGGNTYWSTTQSDMTTAANTMLNTDPAKTYFGATLNDNKTFIEFIYLNTLGKTYVLDPNGIDYWVGELNSGKSKGEVIAALIAAAQHSLNAGTAQDQFNNKVAVSNYVAGKIETCPDINDLSAFVSFISDVTHASSTATAAKLDVDAF